ncbi:MAG TPA: Gfo/Idh/MocA family oxidoreductase [Vicinamibacterales bacterium]|nr:Gfo/Idh/MocA family oxidoreductase [Vicinamibacterales bacterium]
MIRIGVIGYGYWGPNLVRNFAELASARVTVVCDRRPERLALAARRYPGVRTTKDPVELIKDPSVDAVVIATPVFHHFELAMLAIREGKHVLVEKPIASSSEQASQMIEEAARRRVVLMVDHTFVYTSAVRAMRDLVTKGDLGDIYYYDSVRINLGLFQHDVNVLWDLAVHDLSIMDYVLQKQPTAVSATGLAHVPGEPENIAYMTMFFDSPLIGHIHVNWLAPVKVRRTLLGGSRRMVVFDDLEASEKLRVYDKGISVNPSPENVYQLLVGYRTGDMWAPQIDLTEALSVEAAHFAECVARGGTPITDGESGLRVVRLLEAATESMVERGRLVSLNRAVVT